MPCYHNQVVPSLKYGGMGTTRSQSTGRGPHSTALCQQPGPRKVAGEKDVACRVLAPRLLVMFSSVLGN